MDVGNKTTSTLANLQEGSTYYFAVTAYDTAHIESAYSNEVIYTIPQACTYAISPVSQSFNATGGTGSIGLTTSSLCPWTCSSNASWLVITSNSAATGSGTTYYSVSANSNSSSRTGTITIGGRTFTITQSGASPQYTLNLTKAGNGNGTITNNPTGSTFNAGTTVTLTAAPDANSTFAGWSGACSGTASTCTLTLNANASVTATFNPKSNIITATAGTNGTISPQGNVSVNYGTSQNFTITPNTGYRVGDVKVDGTSVGAVSSYSFANVIAVHTIAATFTTNTYSLAISKTGNGNGTITNNPTGSTFNAGTTVTLTAAPDANSTFAGWSGACSGTSSTCTLTLNANASVTATFNPKSNIITATAGTNGTISPQGNVSVNYGASQNFTITPNTGYRVGDVKVDGTSVGAVSSYSFTNVIAVHTIAATFTTNTYSLAINKTGNGSGTVTNNPTGSTFNAGTTVTLTAAPDANSTFAGWSGACSGTASTCTLTLNANASVTATFNPKSYTITATAGANGAISPQGNVSVTQGANQSFSITPKSGFQIADVKADGVSVGAVASFLFGSIMSNHTIEAVFSSVAPQPGVVVFAANAGGSAYTAKSGINYSADQYYQGGRTWKTSSSIAGTEDDPLYKTERYGNFSYSIPVANGNYLVTLRFAEIYWSSANRRIFNVKVEGLQVITNLDIFAKVGKNNAYDVTIPVSVRDGILQIDFITVKDNAKVSAISIQNTP